MGTAKRISAKQISLFFLILFLSCRPATKAAKPTAVSLVPSVTETIFAMGAENHLLAVSSYCDYPPEARNLTKVGSLLSPSYEKIVSLNPDVVFVSLPMQKEVKQKIEQLGIRTVNVSPESINEILQSIILIGNTLNESARAQRLYDSLKTELDNVLRSLPRRGKHPSVYIELSRNPIYTVGGKSFINDYVNAVGWKNIFADVNTGYFPAEAEQIIAHNPQIILLLYADADPDEVKKRVGWQSINAIEHGRVFAVNDADIFLRPGPRFIEAIKRLTSMSSTIKVH